MLRLTHQDLVLLLTAIGFMLLLSRLFAELGKKFKMPVVMGEIFLGILLGPTFLGIAFPEISKMIVPTNGGAKIALDGIVSLASIMLLFVAGMEVQLDIVLKQGKTAIYTSITTMVIPFAIGFGVVHYFPYLFHFEPANKLVYALFLGTAMSISALPVITRILMDLNLFKTNVGMVILASAILGDLVGWLIFSFILSLMGGNDVGATSIKYTLGMILFFGLFMLFIGKRLINKSLPWIQTKLSWPGGVLSICLGCCFLAAAFTESIGLHAILGAFIMGIAFGDSVHLHEKAREIIHQFVTNVFAPLFFVSIGLHLNFIENFNAMLVMIILIIAMLSKLLGAILGGYLSGISRGNSLAIGFGLNARGTMEIILGTLALNAGIIDEEMLVALVIMAVVTSMISGPLMKKFIEI